MSNELISKDEITNELVNEIKDLIINARKKVAQQVNETLVDTYWNIGKVIVEKEQSEKIKAEINEEGDNKPIGIILCADKDNVVAEYSIGGMNNNLFASNYTYYIPKQEELIAQVEQVIRENEEEKQNKEKK